MANKESRAKLANHAKEETMFMLRFALLSLLTTVFAAGCASPESVTRQGAAAEANRGLVGAWIITADRARGVGKNLLTFSSDGTFFRSGDTHPIYSGGHGAWKRVGDKEFAAMYIAFNFDQNGKWIGSNKVRIHITQGPGDNEFTAATKASRRDLQDNEISMAQGRLTGKRIEVEPF